MSSRTWLAAAIVLLASGCAPTIQKVAPEQPSVTPVLWQEPPATKDLFFGSGGRELAPDPDTVYTLIKRDTGGFSTTLDLEDPEGREWSAKLGPEAQPEVVASRIVWALGFPQPPSFYSAKIRVKERDAVTEEGPVRLRPKVEWLDSQEPWSWHQNPFVDSQPYRGLLVLLMVLNSTDLKDDNNMRYLVRRAGEPREQWYAVKDLGASLGDTGRLFPERNDVEAFESHRFITGLDGQGYVKFAFKGRHQELLKRIRPDDVRWTCARLNRLPDEAFEAAFKAGGVHEDTARRFIRKIREKVQEGLNLAPARASR